PYVTPGNVYGPESPFCGRGGWTWYTGSAAWLFRVSTEWILGVRPAWDGLEIRPALPPHWKGFRMRRVFRGATYDIVVRRGARPTIRVDGEPWSSEVVPAFADGRRHRVELTLAAVAKPSLDGKRRVAAVAKPSPDGKRRGAVKG